MNNYFQIYLSMNILLLVSYFIFKLFFYRPKSKPNQIVGSSALFLGRAILIISIALPVLVGFFPATTKIPEVNYSYFQSFGKTSNTKSVLPSPGGQKQVSFKTVAPSTPVDSKQIFFLLFILGMCLCLLPLTKEILILSRILHESVHFKKVGKVNLVISTASEVPFSFLGLKGPIVVLPASLLNDGQYLRYAVSHELQHVRQRDVHWMFGLEVIKIFFWWNPAIYLWKKVSIELAELVCDQRVINRNSIESKDYGKCLITIAERSMNQINQFRYVSAMASGHKSQQSFLSRRIDMLMIKNSKLISIKKLMLKAGGLSTILLCFALVTRVQASKSIIETHPGIQTIVKDMLKRGIEKAGAKSGFAAVTNPNTGEVLAFIQLNKVANKWSSKSDSKLFSQTYEPLSHIKPIVASIALDKNLFAENSVLNGKGGKLSVGGRVFHDWKDHGMITFADTVVQSSFVGTYRMTEKIGENDLYQGLEKFGFGANGSAAEVSWATSGQLHQAKDSKKKFNLAYLANGMGNIHVTPVEILQAYGAIANGGNILKAKGYSTKDHKSEVVRRAISEETSKKMRRILYHVVTEGTGKWAQSSKYAIAGKTASGWAKESDKKLGKANRGTFIGFAPYKDPQLLAYVIIDQPKGSAHGGKHAAPVVRSILNKALSHLKVEEDHFASSH
jgi:beta-lactamase regulating signal transducer with metallopeptidase domain